MAESLAGFLASLALLFGSVATASLDESCVKTERFGKIELLEGCNLTCAENGRTRTDGYLCVERRRHYGFQMSAISGVCENKTCVEDLTLRQAFTKLVEDFNTEESQETPLNTTGLLGIYVLRNGSTIADKCKLGHHKRADGTRCIYRMIRPRGNGLNITIVYGFCEDGKCWHLGDEGYSYESSELFDVVRKGYYDSIPAC